MTRRAYETLRAAAAECRNCPLWKPATQTVFGEGPVPAPVMLVGEQPGHEEDLAGHPFVGPAGKVLDRALEAAGIARQKAYVTNAVKHFKFTPRGKRRIHQKPVAGEIRACHPWLEEELRLVRPKLVVAMGATALQAVLGKAMPVGKNRGRLSDLSTGQRLLVTVHPSMLLRLREKEERLAGFRLLVADLRLALPFV
jgi:DNA polymerase